MRGLLLAALLALSGCVEAATTAISHARDTDRAAWRYVLENISARVELRRLCMEVFNAQFKELLDAKDYEGAKALVRDSYPPLVTFDIVASIKDKETVTALSKPYICGV